MNYSQTLPRLPGGRLRQSDRSSWCVALALCLSSWVLPASASIIAIGDVNPVYDGTDPWEVFTPTVGVSAAGTLNIDDGSIVRSSSLGLIGSRSGSNGVVTVSGAGSSWLNSRLIIGDEGTGTLNIEAGGYVRSRQESVIGRNAGALGSVTVSGPGSQWEAFRNFSVGRSGNGTLNIEAGGVVNSGGVSFVGENAGSTGTLTVSGNDARWDIDGDLSIGHSGTGTANIEAGGVVNNRALFIGANTGSSGTVTVSGVGSQWDSSTFLHVGGRGSGALNIEQGGGVNSREGVIGLNPGSTGMVTVTGAGSQWNSDSLAVGRSGPASLIIEEGGLVRSRFLVIDTTGNGSSIDMASGGMLALLGDMDDSLSQFLDGIGGMDTIRYWDAVAIDWADITRATLGVDYMLGLGAGDLAGYTVLTVLAAESISVPEPMTLLLLAGGLGLLRWRARG